MVFDTGFLPALTECPSKEVTGPSLTEEITDLLLNPMLKKSGGILHSQFSPFNSQEGGKPPNPGEMLQGYLKQPPPSPHGSSQADMG